MNRFALFLTVLASSTVFSEQNIDQHRIGSAATAHPLATETAELIYQRGGNAVDAAVAASFNAPIAGALFAHEVIVGHFAMSAFTPIVIASVVGTIVSRIYFGDVPAFDIAEQ